MIFSIFPVWLLCALLIGCSANRSMENASVNFKKNKDYQSLEMIYHQLSKETPRKEVECLIGEADYSPADGLYYYASTQSKYSMVQNQEVVCGLVVDYREKNGVVTATLQDFWRGLISE